MEVELKYAIFKTRAGWMGILGSVKGLLQITLPQRSAEEVRLLLGERLNQASSSPQSFEDLIRRLKAYFEDEKITFPAELDFAGATLFQREVWKRTRLITYGETRSYSWVAEQIGKPRAVRAVGQALSKNPLPIIVPCHRVVASDGRLCGFRGGLEMKKRLLSMEASAE